MSNTSMRAALLSLAVLSGVSFLASVPAMADTMKECSVKYQAAKKNGTLNGADWKSFRAAQCNGAAPMAKTDSASANGVSGAGKTAMPTAAMTPPAAAPVATAPSASAKTSPAAVPGSSAAVFPAAVDPKYSSLTAGKARMKTCLDQYKANKAGNGNGGLKWVEKGGGYYSACSKKLKGV